MNQARLAFRPLFVMSVVALFGAAFPSAAQVGGLGRITGQISDAQGGAVPLAKVQLTNRATSAQLEMLSQDDGSYVFPRVAPGEYSLAVQKTGFQRANVEISLPIDTALRADVNLQLGRVEETVNVTAAAAALQTQSSESSTVITSQLITDIPLNGRDFARLIRLAPGMGSYISTEGSNSTPPVSGSRHAYNTYTIDGLGNNDERAVAGMAAGGGAAYFDNISAPNVISTEAIQEFRVVTSNADATFGRSSGGQINAITRSGSNDFHGSIYEFLRNDKMDARNFFNYGPFFDSEGRSITPPFRQNLFGASVGGRLVRDRHFFFASYEGFRQRLQQTGSYVAPNAELISLMPGDLRRYYQAFIVDRGVLNGSGTLRPVSASDRAAAVAAGFTPSLFDGNLANGEAGSVLLSTASTRNVDQNAVLVRTDHIFTDKFRMALRYADTRADQTTAVGLPLDLRRDARSWHSGVAELVYTPTPSQVLEVRLGVLRPTFIQAPDEVNSGLVNIGVRRDLGLNVAAAVVGLTDAGVLGSNAFLDNQSVPQAQAQHTWTRGGLTLRTGVDLSWLKVSIHNGAGRPGYSFNSLVGPTGLLGAAPGQAQAVAASASASIFGANGGPTTALRGFTSSRQEFFVQSDWRVKPSITLNLGLRYSYFGPYSEVNGAISNLYAVDNGGTVHDDLNPLEFGRTANQVLPANGDRRLYQADRNNFQPRVGVAWNPGFARSTVFRAAYGLYSDRLFQLLLSAQGGLVNNPPFTVASSAASVPFQLGGALPVVSGIPLITAINPQIRNPYTHRVTAGVQQEVGRNTTVTANYVGTFARSLPGVMEINGGSALPSALRPDSRFSVQRLIDNTSTSNYHALQISASQRFGRGLAFQASYTLADMKDDASGETFAIFPGYYNQSATTAPGYNEVSFAPRPRSADWGNSDFLFRHIFTAGYVWELPFRSRRAALLTNGWSLSGMVTARSGEPIDLRLGVDADKDGNTGDRPALLSGSLDQLHASGLGRTQHLVPTSSATGILEAPTAPNDPFAVVPRNALFGPGAINFDLSVLKAFTITERVRLRFEANAFNVFNHAQLANPSATLSSALFGVITSTAAGTSPRQMQLGLKLLF